MRIWFFFLISGSVTDSVAVELFSCGSGLELLTGIVQKVLYHKTLIEASFKMAELEEPTCVAFSSCPVLWLQSYLSSFSESEWLTREYRCTSVGLSDMNRG